MVAFSLPPPQPGRLSSSSGRAMQRSRIGAPRDRSAMWSTRSRNVASPHWMSSKQTTSGRSSALSSSCARTAQKSSFGLDAPSTMRLTVASARCAELLQHRDDRPEGDAVAVVEATAVQHCRVEPVEQLADEPRLADAGRAEQREQVAAAARGRCARTPDGAARARAAADERRVEPACDRLGLGVDLERAGMQPPAAASPSPRRRSARRAPRPGRALRVSAPISTSPGSAACSSRAATFTASPVTSVSPSPATTSPVLTPIRARRPSAGTAARISHAARTARRASSSWETGTPKTAITASPMNFSTVPPWRSRIVRISS